MLQRHIQGIGATSCCEVEQAQHQALTPVRCYLVLTWGLPYLGPTT